MVALKSRWVTGGGPCGLGGGRDPLRCVGGLGETRTGYDQSGVAGVPARSPRPPRLASPPESPVLAETQLVGATVVTPAVTPPEAEDPQREDIVLPS